MIQQLLQQLTPNEAVVAFYVIIVVGGICTFAALAGLGVRVFLAVSGIKRLVKK